MKVAISTDGKAVSGHFGRCQSYTLVDIEDGKVVKRDLIANPGHQPGFIPKFLHDLGVNCIIAGGMGARASDLFQDFGIDVVIGASGTVDDAIKSFLAGNLSSSGSVCEHGDGDCDHDKNTETSIDSSEKVVLSKGSKLCVTSEGDSIDSAVDPRFGRCSYFMIVDADTLEFEAVKNPNTDGAGGVGIKSAQFIADKGVSALITGNVGPNAFDTLNAAGVDIATGASGTVKDAVEAYKMNRLSVANAPTTDAKSGI